MAGNCVMGSQAADSMKINANLSRTGVNRAATPPCSTPTTKMLSNRVSLTNLSALEQALERSPASRPEMVEQARALIANPDYPSPDILSEVARHLAAALTSQEA
jgi:hypothetical protein